MKHSFFIFLVLMLASCASTKKIQETTASVVVETQQVEEATKHESERVVDTTRTEHGKVVITEIIFDTTPTTDASIPDTRASPDAEPGDGKTESNRTPPTASVNIPGVGQVSGNIKSIRQTIIENDIEQKGESKESEKQEESKCNANALVADTKTDKISQPAPDPKRWRYIFYILAILAVALLYLKRTPIVEWIKKILSGLRRIF